MAPELGWGACSSGERDGERQAELVRTRRRSGCRCSVAKVQGLLSRGGLGVVWRAAYQSRRFRDAPSVHQAGQQISTWVTVGIVSYGHVQCLVCVVSRCRLVRCVQCSAAGDVCGCCYESLNAAITRWAASAHCDICASVFVEVCAAAHVKVHAAIPARTRLPIGGSQHACALPPVEQVSQTPPIPMVEHRRSPGTAIV